MGISPPLRSLADPVEKQDPGLGYQSMTPGPSQNDVGASCPPKRIRPSLDLEPFALQPCVTGVLGSSVVIVHFLDARQRTVRDALAGSIRVSQDWQCQCWNLEMNEPRRITMPLDPRYIRLTYSEDLGYVDSKNSVHTNQTYLWSSDDPPLFCQSGDRWSAHMSLI